MFIHNLFEPYEIEHVQLDECPVGTHRNTFFELTYIVNGSGLHRVSGSEFAYGKGALFLLLPQDTHSFEVTTTTSFLFIRFTDIYIKAQQVKSRHGNLGDWITKLEHIFQSNYHLPGCILQGTTDKSLVAALSHALIQEYLNRQDFRREVIQQLVNALITVVARNISRISIVENKADQDDHAMDILRYIQEHIYSPESLKAEVIASQFHISHSYIYEYFRKHTGESLRQYITNYRLKLVESRLRYSDMRMSEIVDEVGFTDESHLNRVFKKHKGLSPSAFRKKISAKTSHPTTHY